MMVWAITMTGLTMGIDEVDIGSARKDVHNKIYEAYDRAEELIRAYYEEDEEILPCAPGRTLYETLELNLMSLLNKVRGDAGNIASHFLGDTAHSVIMTKSGARGNPLNLAQMAACVGQQSVRQNRIHRGYIDRTLPHFKVKDLSPAARGFVLNSYRDGLTPTEFFFHAMGGREGLVDTAVRTSSSGYMQRRLVNALQDMVVENDLSVRTSENMVVQFKYGDDGIDPGRSDAGKIMDFEQAILKTRAFKDLIKKEETITGSLSGKNHPEFPVDYVKRIANEGFSTIEQIGEAPQVRTATKVKSKAKSPLKSKVESKKEPKTESKKESTAMSSIEEFEAVDPAILTEEDWYNWYKLETGKNAVYHSKITKIFQNWKASKLVEVEEKTLEVNEEAVDEESSEEAEEEVEQTISSRDISQFSDKEWMEMYHQETGKDAIYHGKTTKLFKKWKKSKLEEQEPSEMPFEPEVETEQNVVEETSDLANLNFKSLTIEERYQLYTQETGKKAIVRGSTTKIYKNWEAKKMEDTHKGE
ncbi:MAG: hypothetical protein DRO88_08525 [Promethearchaeia archaeon]|nr:MAG: hypothetical protein DRO88_08525 [Candidatus Lokiarchaeia archaeon]